VIDGWRGHTDSVGNSQEILVSYPEIPDSSKKGHRNATQLALEQYEIFHQNEPFIWPIPNLSFSRRADYRIDAMAESKLYPRLARRRLEEALVDTPVVLIHEPHQCGKTTLARMVGDAAGYSYTTFDDDVQLAAAQADPVGFVADLPDKIVLDEVQRVSALFW